MFSTGTTPNAASPETTFSKTSRKAPEGEVFALSPKNCRTAFSLKAPCSPWKATASGAACPFFTAFAGAGILCESASRFPTTGAIAPRSRSRRSTMSKVRLCGPSESAFSGSGWHSSITPSAPAAMAAIARGAT